MPSLGRRTITPTGPSSAFSRPSDNMVKAVVHAQYNTPIRLYNKEVVNETFEDKVKILGEDMAR